MELRHIRYFLTLAEELNFSRAAEKLHIAQPHLSRQIQELENQIGVQLFHRTKRQVELTNAGKAFMKKAYEIIDLVEQASTAARLSSLGTDGELRIGFTGTVQNLIPTLQKYRKLFPKVKIELKYMNNTEQIVALNENKIDIAVVSTPIDNENIYIKPVKKLSFVLALPEKHPLAKKKTLSLSDLENETFIMTPKSAGPMYYETVMSIFQNTDYIPNQTIEVHDLQTALILVSNGMGMILTPTPIHTLNGVVYRNLKDVDLSIMGFIAWRKDNKSEILKKFLTFFFSYVQKDDEILRYIQRDNEHFVQDNTSND